MTCAPNDAAPRAPHLRTISPYLGFTLIEVLVALVIVAFGMGAVLTALTKAAENTGRLREKTFAEWVGLNQLTTARLAIVPIVLGTTEDAQKDVKMAGSQWHWRQTIEKYDIPGIVRITVEVRHADGPKDTWLASVVGFHSDAITHASSDLALWDTNATTPNGSNVPQTPPAQPGSPAPADSPPR